MFIMQNSPIASKPAGQTTPSGQKLVGATVATVAILRRLYGAGGPLRLIDVAEPLALNRSTAFNILRTLAHEGVVAFDAAAKTYALRSDFAQLMRSGRDPKVARAQRLREGMSRIAKLYDVHLAHWVIEDDQLVLATVAESHADVKLTQRQGQSAALVQGAVGRAIAAELPMSDDEIAEQHRRAHWVRPQSLDALMTDIRRARRRGWADDGGSLQPGVRAIAVAVRDERGAVDGGVAAVLFVGQYDAEGEAAIAAALQQVAATAANGDSAIDAVADPLR